MATAQLTETPPWAAEYPFLTFGFRLNQLPSEAFVLLGECSSKIEHVMGTPLRADTADRLNRVSLVKGIHATTAIEGNTLSEDQVGQRVAGKLELPPTQEYLGREIDNIVTAYNYLFKQLEAGVPFHFSSGDLKALNRMVLEGLEVDSGVLPGEYRQIRVGVGDYRPPPPEHVEELVELGCEWLNHQSWTAYFGGPFVIPIVRAILTHLYIAWIHPFGDGNGRTARLVEFDLLIRAGVPLSCAHLLSDYYNRTRARYYRALSAARQDVVNFVFYAVQGLREMLREQIKSVRDQQLEVTWENYVYAVFRKEEDSVTAKRQREVALMLGRARKSVAIDNIRELSPKLVALYHDLTTRTLQRDLRELRHHELIEVDANGARANLGLVMAFLPAKGAAIQRKRDTEKDGSPK